MSREVMDLVDKETGEMKCRVCGAVRFVRRKEGSRSPPEELWCIHGCRMEDLD